MIAVAGSAAKRAEIRDEVVTKIRALFAKSGFDPDDAPVVAQATLVERMVVFAKRAPIEAAPMLRGVERYAVVLEREALSPLVEGLLSDPEMIPAQTRGGSCIGNGIDPRVMSCRASCKQRSIEDRRRRQRSSTRSRTTSKSR